MTRQKAGEQKDGLTKRGSKWSYIVRVPDPITGTTKQKWISGFATKEEAKSARDLARTESRQGVFVSPSKITVQEHFEEWISLKKTKVKATTADNYRQILDFYILPKFGNTLLKDLNAFKIERFYLDLAEGGSRKGKPLSRSTVRLVSIVLAQGLERAVKDRKLALNPAKGIERPVGKTRRNEPFTASELKTFFAGVEGHRLSSFYRLSAYTGARRGELVALRWTDMDLDKGIITISKNRTRVRNEVIEQDSTKGGEGRRTIDIDLETTRIMKAHKVRQNQERLLLGEHWHETGYIFVQEHGLPIDPDTPSKLFQSVRERLGLREQTLHDLRHLHATELLRHGVGIHLVKERLGHKDISITLEIYGHIRADDKKAVADQFVSAIENG